MTSYFKTAVLLAGLTGLFAALGFLIGGQSGMMIAFLMAYSEFAIGWLFVEKPATVTLSMSIYAMVQTGNAQPWSYLGSLVLIMSAPVVAIFLLLQRTLLDRMMFGATGD